MAKIRGISEYPEGSGTWWIDFRDGQGKRRREKIGRRAKAIDEVARRRREVKEGRYVPKRRGTRLTFRDLAKAAMAQKKLRLAPGSYEIDSLRLNKLLPLIGKVPADQMNTPRLEETMAHLKKSVSNSTVNRYRSLISSIYSFGVRSEHIAFNPVARVKPYRENESRLRWLKDDEEPRLRAAIRNPFHMAELDLALNTGMRRGEQFKLEWSNVDLERGNLTVHGKSGRRHIVANQTALGALRKLKEASGGKKYVCPDATDEVKRDWRTWFEDAVEEAGIHDFRFHDLRHTFASRLVMAGVDIRTAQELLGHKNIAQTMRYSHLSADHRKAAVEKMNAPVDGLP
jgi:integrase